MDTAVKPQGYTNLKLRQLSRVVTRHYDAYVARHRTQEQHAALHTPSPQMRIERELRLLPCALFFNTLRAFCIGGFHQSAARIAAWPEPDPA